MESRLYSHVLALACVIRLTTSTEVHCTCNFILHVNVTMFKQPALKPLGKQCNNVQCTREFSPFGVMNIHFDKATENKIHFQQI